MRSNLSTESLPPPGWLRHYNQTAWKGRTFSRRVVYSIRCVIQEMNWKMTYMTVICYQTNYQDQVRNKHGKSNNASFFTKYYLHFINKNLYVCTLKWMEPSALAKNFRYKK
ncbi:hypothetical protein XENOCAPTIV_029352 [Xenoophorus captivus]|uniref:Uncharacterized protein n=1 Tax=Xenoophorus captivus TaxID=1517983 RepID=A0ABV0RMY4_9TELE